MCYALWAHIFYASATIGTGTPLFKILDLPRINVPVDLKLHSFFFV